MVLHQAMSFEEMVSLSPYLLPSCLKSRTVLSTIPNSMSEFKFEFLIGRGSFASVFRAIHIRTGFPIAIKSIDIARSAPWQLR